MRTALVVTAVVAAHVAAVAGVMIIQGCGTIVRPSAPPEPPLMPPAPEEMAAPEPVPVKPEPQQWPAETTTYTVRPGDSLSVIATRYGLSVAEIVALNGIRNPDMIREGQKLVLPGSVDVEAPAPATKRSAVQPPPGGQTYVVKPGDTLSEIAVRFGSTVKALRRANNLSGDKILVDQTLVIPAGGSAEPPVPAPATAAPERGAVPAEIDLDSEPMTAPADMDTGMLPEEDAGPAPAPAAGEAEYREYTVQGDEDLYSVAMMWNVSVADIKALNDLDGSDLEPGQTLKIPLPE